MDIRKALTEQIRRCRNRMNLARVIDCGVLFAAAGGVAGMFCELFSLLWPFYHAHLAAGLCFAVGLLAGIGYALYRRADMRQAARRLDSFGLEERMITAYEWMDRGDEAGEIFAEPQRQDAWACYERLRHRIKIPLCPDKRHVLALILSAMLVAALGIVPSPVRERAQTRHQVQEQVKKEVEELEEFVDALEGVDMDSLTPEQRERLREITEAMRRSGEELRGAESWESLGAAAERLDYKYGQAQQSLEQLAAQLEDPRAAGVATAQALARAANPNGTGQVSPQAAVSPGQSGNGSQGSGDGGQQDNGGGTGQQGGGDGTGQQGGGDGGQQDNGGGTDQQGNGNGTGQQGSGDGAGQQGNGNGTGQQGNGDGTGQQGGGDGTGNGDGTGQGSGAGQGNSGSGGGRGTGSSNAAHDYVSIPNAVGDDPSLTGNKYGDDHSDYIRQQNGLAWEGEHVDYNSVIGQYTDSAYEGIVSGRYPVGMESVIRDYFENLNK